MNDWRDTFSEAPLAAGSARAVRRWIIHPNGVLVGSYGTTWHSATLKAWCGRAPWAAKPDWDAPQRCACTRPLPCRECAAAGEPVAAPTMGSNFITYIAAGPEKCGCGIWAYWRHHASPYSPSATGVIEATGRTILGPAGLRTAHARILALCTDPRDRSRQALEDRYQVPVFTSQQNMLAEYPTTPEVYTPPEGSRKPPSARENPHVTFTALNSQIQNTADAITTAGKITAMMLKALHRHGGKQ